MKRSLKADPRQKLFTLQNALHEKIKTDIADYIGRPSTTLKRYQTEYERDLQTYERLSDKRELIREVMQSDIVYCGDYHTLRQSQRTLIRILRECVHHDQDLVLALEMVAIADQGYLDRYMANLLSDAPFLEKIRYSESWGFNWPDYKQLLEFARHYGIPCYGLNVHVPKGKPVLRERDQAAANSIVELLDNHPDATVCVMYGDHHIARNHIPKAVTCKLGKARSNDTRQLIVYQNSEQLYWSLAELGLEQKVDVLRLDEHRYCVMNTAPWVKLQSYLTWLEDHEADSVLADGSLSDRDDSFDLYQQLLDIGHSIATFVDLESTAIEDFHVYLRDDITFLSLLRDFLSETDTHSALDGELLQAEVIYNGSCLIPDNNTIYLASTNINKAAEKMAQFIHKKDVGHTIIEDAIIDPLNLYFGRILFEAIGYVGSKIVNYKRKTNLFSDMRTQLKQSSGKRLHGRRKDTRESQRLVLEHQRCLHQEFGTMSGRPRWHHLVEQPASILYATTRDLGRILGEHLYMSVLEGQLEKEVLHQLFAQPIRKTLDNGSVYFNFVHVLQDHYHSTASKEDRF